MEREYKCVNNSYCISRCITGAHRLRNVSVGVINMLFAPCGGYPTLSESSSYRWEVLVSTM